MTRVAWLGQPTDADQGGSYGTLWGHAGSRDRERRPLPFDQNGMLVFGSIMVLTASEVRRLVREVRRGCGEPSLELARGATFEVTRAYWRGFSRDEATLRPPGDFDVRLQMQPPLSESSGDALEA